VFEKNRAPVRPDGEFVLYWMISSRRVRWNFAFDRAVDWAKRLGRPLLVFEPLRCGGPWTSDRTHRFVLDGMRDNAAALAGTGIGYLPYVEPERGAGGGLLDTLASRASVVVTDEYPTHFLPRMVGSVGDRLPVRLEAVDSNGLMPFGASDKAYARAFDFRRHLQRHLPLHLSEFPESALPAPGTVAPWRGLPKGLTEPWLNPAPGLLRLESPGGPAGDPTVLAGAAGTAGTEPYPEFALDRLPIDHSVPPVDERGGSEAATRALERFLDERLAGYGAERNHPDAGAGSGLSAWLHFGHLSSHQILDAIARRTDWTPWRIGGEEGGRRRGWWRLDESTEAFLDEVVTWRELCYHFAHHRPDHASFSSLPDWARATLLEHASDPRPFTYTLEQFDAGETHDELWNAAQRELRESGRVHNYLRMLWGKKILHWSGSPEEAWAILIELNNRYAIDGRDPNSYGGIGWVLGRFDRAWGPERPIFGKVRYMSSKNTHRKLRLKGYLERWSGGA
jgi:deoxyribodipyrimidine photo-lyase